MKPPPKLPPDAQRRLEAVPPELRELLAACYPTDEMDAQARLDDAERERQRARDEQEALLDLADAAEEGDYGLAGKQLAEGIFKTGGRCPYNLRALRDALRQLSPRARRRREPTTPQPIGRLAAGKR